MSKNNSMMDALVLHGIDEQRFEKVSKPTPGANEVLVKIAYCGVCGSDIPRTYVHGTYNFPTICGHEFAGTIEVCGDEVNEYSPGERVAVFPLIWCGKCPACEEGKYVQCSDYDYLGSRSDGAFAEYVVAPKGNLLRVPDGVSLAEAAMTEPAAVALHAVKRAGGSFIGETVVVFGAGPIGLMAAQWAKVMGASQVVIFDVISGKLDVAMDLGFELAYNVREHDPLEIINGLTNGKGADVVIEGAGVPPTFIQALKVVGRRGRVVVLGNPSGDVNIPEKLISQIMRREVNIYGCWNSEFSTSGNADDWHPVLEAIRDKKLLLGPLITHKVELENACSALEMMNKQSEFFLKVLINVGER
jgi:L-iditol 2-dehydrogenase